MLFVIVDISHELALKNSLDLIMTNVIGQLNVTNNDISMH